MKKLIELIKLIFKAVALAMGVTVVAMLIMDVIAMKNAVMLLATGLSCSAMANLMKTANKDEDN